MVGVPTADRLCVSDGHSSVQSHPTGSKCLSIPSNSAPSDLNGITFRNLEFMNRITQPYNRNIVIVK